MRTRTIREIRGWGPATPIPHAPADVIGVMNLRGTVIPIIDLANKLGMKSTEPNERSAIVVAEVHGMAMGLVVDRVSDILTIAENLQTTQQNAAMVEQSNAASAALAGEAGKLRNLVSRFKLDGRVSMQTADLLQSSRCAA